MDLEQIWLNTSLIHDWSKITWVLDSYILSEYELGQFFRPLLPNPSIVLQNSLHAAIQDVFIFQYVQSSKHCKMG